MFYILGSNSDGTSVLISNIPRSDQLPMLPPGGEYWVGTVIKNEVQVEWVPFVAAFVLDALLDAGKSDSAHGAMMFKDIRSIEEWLSEKAATGLAA